MKEALLHLFRYNDAANCMQLETILKLPDNVEAVRLFSHLITSQRKWLNRITQKQPDSELSWFETPFAPQELAGQWKKAWRNGSAF